MLFPGHTADRADRTLTRRHTHAVILRNTPGTGVDVWLDGTQVATAAPNPLAVLAQRAAAVPAQRRPRRRRVLVPRGRRLDPRCRRRIAAILTYETRWTLGPRKGIQILVTGQSNAGNGLNDGAWHLLAQGVAWHLGALAYGVVGLRRPPAATCIHGEGIYPVPALGFPGSFLTNPGDGSNPSTWASAPTARRCRPGSKPNTAADRRRRHRGHPVAVVGERQHPAVQRKGDL